MKKIIKTQSTSHKISFKLGNQIFGRLMQQENSPRSNLRHIKILRSQDKKPHTLVPPPLFPFFVLNFFGAAR